MKIANTYIAKTINLVCRQSLSFGLLMICSKLVFSQVPVNYNQFDRIPSVQVPSPKAYQMPNYGPFAESSLNGSPNNNQSELSEVLEQNRKLIQQQDLLEKSLQTTQANQKAQYERDLMEFNAHGKTKEQLMTMQSYQIAFRDISGLNPDHFFLTRVQFDVENAYLDGSIPYDQFVRGIKLRAAHVRQILKREGLRANNNLALNYGIQQLYQHSNVYYDSLQKKSITIPPFTYQFEDYMGEKDYENVFTEKLMQTGKGQCLSMPRMYLMIAEQLGAKAWLSLSPQHSFIQFTDNNGRLLNYETTNGNLASNTWLASSGYINSKAVKSKSYLDTLSQRQLYAECLVDLLMGYLKKMDYDDFAEQVKQKILQIDPTNMRAWIIDAQIKKSIAIQKIVAAGRPSEKDLPNYPEAYQAYLDMKAAIDRVEDLGYQNMPPEAYQAWLKSIDLEKKRQANRELNQRMQTEIQELKRMKSTLQRNNAK